MGLESRCIEVFKTRKREIIHGEFFEIFGILVLFPVLSGLEPGTLSVLADDRTSVPPSLEVKAAKIFVTRQ